MTSIKTIVADLPPELAEFGKSNTVIGFKYNGTDYSVQYTNGQMRINRQDPVDTSSTIETGDQHEPK